MNVRKLIPKLDIKKKSGNGPVILPSKIAQLIAMEVRKALASKEVKKVPIRKAIPIKKALKRSMVELRPTISEVNATLLTGIANE